LRRSLRDFFEVVVDGDNDNNNAEEEEDEDNDEEEDSFVTPTQARKKQKLGEEDVQEVDNITAVEELGSDEKEIKVEELGSDKLGSDELESDEEEVKVCHECGGTPCDWTHYQDEIIEFAWNSHFFLNHTDQDNPFSFPVESFSTMMDERKDEIKTHHQDYKKRCFRCYTYLKHGRLGQGNRVPLPSCIEDAIRAMFPNHDNSFIGYHSL
jgi:hypothetical protein